MTTNPDPSGDVALLRRAAEHAPRVLPEPLGTTASRWLTAEADCHASAGEVGQGAAALVDTLAGDPADTTGFRVVVSTLPSAVAFARQVLALPIVVAPGVEPLAAYVESWLNAYTDNDLPALVSDIAPKLAASLDEDVLSGLRAELEAPLVPSPVSRVAEDTGPLRDLIHAAAQQGIKDWDTDYDSRAAGPVTDYVMGVVHYAYGRLRSERDALAREVERLTAERARQNDVVRMLHEQAAEMTDTIRRYEDAALLGAEGQAAAAITALRAQVDRFRSMESFESGRAEQATECVQDLLAALDLGPMPDRPLDTVWNTLLDIVRGMESGRAATASAALRDREEVKAVRAERDALSRMLRGMARRLGWMRSDCGDNLDAALRYKRERDEARAGVARSAPAIPKDAAEQIAQCLADYWIDLRGGRVPFEETDAGQAQDVLALLRSWLPAPAADPAPAPAIGGEETVRLTRAELMSGILVGIGGEHDTVPTQTQLDRAVDMIFRYARRRDRQIGAAIVRELDRLAADPAPAWHPGKPPQHCSHTGCESRPMRFAYASGDAITWQCEHRHETTARWQAPAEPQADPAPATGGASSPEWRAGWAAACRALDAFAAARMDAADDRDDKPVADAYGAVTVRAQSWMFNPERAGQAPAQPTATPDKWRQAYEHKLGDFARETERTSSMLAAVREVPGHLAGRERNGFLIAQARVRAAAESGEQQPSEPAVCTGLLECPAGEHHPMCNAARAAREDTATPDVHEVTVGTEQHENYFFARCTVCGHVASDFDEQWVQDRADAHRADTLRPSGPLSPIQPDTTKEA